MCPHQEPIDVHEQQGKKKSVEEEVKGDVGHRLEARHTCGVQHFEREPVETEPEPGNRNTNIIHGYKSSIRGKRQKHNETVKITRVCGCVCVYLLSLTR